MILSLLPHQCAVFCRYFLRYGPNINLSGESCGAAAWRRLAGSGPVWALVGTGVFGSFGYFAFTLHQPLFFRDVFSFSIEEVNYFVSFFLLGSFSL